MKKRWKFITGILCITFLCCSCDKGHNTLEDNPYIDETNLDDYQTKLNVIKPMAYSSVEGLDLAPGSYISLISRDSQNSYWDEVEAGAQRAIDDLNEALGYEGDDKITLNFIAPDECDDVDEQVNILDEELDRYPAAVCISMIDASACQVQFDLAAENQIPIIAFDSGSDYHGIITTCSTDNSKAAQTAATHLASSIEESGEIALFVQDSNSMTAVQREEGFVNTIKTSHPDISIVNVYHLDELDEMAEEIAQNSDNDLSAASITQEDVIKYILESNPNLKGIFTTNLDTTQLVASVIKDAQRTDLKLIGFDGGLEQLQLLEDGTLEGLIIQNPYGIGYSTVIAAARASLGLPNESSVDTGFVWVTNANLHESSIQKMLY